MFQEENIYSHNCHTSPWHRHHLGHYISQAQCITLNAKPHLPQRLHIITHLTLAPISTEIKDRKVGAEDLTQGTRINNYL